MVKTVKTSNLCNLSAEEFWALRMDVGFDLFMANARSGGCEVLELKEQGESVTRTTLLTYQENPIPPALRGMLRANEFSCKVKARWSRYKFEAGHGMAFTSEPPVFADKIKVGGKTGNLGDMVTITRPPRGESICTPRNDVSPCRDNRYDKGVY